MAQDPNKRWNNKKKREPIKYVKEVPVKEKNEDIGKLAVTSAVPRLNGWGEEAIATWIEKMYRHHRQLIIGIATTSSDVDGWVTMENINESPDEFLTRVSKTNNQGE